MLSFLFVTELKLRERYNTKKRREKLYEELLYRALNELLVILYLQSKELRANQQEQQEQQ